MDTYDAAVKSLLTPDMSCRAAATLARLGEVRSLMPLMAAYESQPEVAGRCLLDAMEQLDGEKQAAILMRAEDAGQRRTGAHLAELFASDDQLGPLAIAAHDVDDRVRAQALRSLGLQKQTATWELTMVELLDDDRVELRAVAIDKLARRYTDSARAALRARLDRETDPRTRADLARAIHGNEAHVRTP